MNGRNALLIVSVCLLFALLVVGAAVTAGNFGAECGVNVLQQDWPLCNGHLFPPLALGPMVEYSHRILASLSALFLILTTVSFSRARPPKPRERALVYAATALIFVEIGVGGVVVNTNLSAAVVTLHQALAILIFGLAVAAAAKALQKPGAPGDAGAALSPLTPASVLRNSVASHEG